MPTYEYECPKCGTFELEQKISEEPVKCCPVCNEEVKRQISNTNFVLKGKGWAKDGYGPSKGKK